MKVQQYLEPYIHNQLYIKNSLIIEGPHVDPFFMQKMINKYGQ